MIDCDFLSSLKRSYIMSVVLNYSSILETVKNGIETKIRKDAVTHLLKIIEDGGHVDAEEIESLYQAEKDIGVAAELLRILTKLQLIQKHSYDPVAAFDRMLTPDEEVRLREEIERLQNVYDRTHEEKGAFERKYRIIGKIAEGGMGRIFKGVRIDDESLVAIKFLMKEELEKNNNLGRIIARFRREGELLTKRLKHRHIIKAFEYGEADGEHFLVMEFLDGGTLADRIKNGPMPFHMFRDISLQLCEAVEYLHRSDVIHRDIKPTNIMFCNHQGPTTIKLCDFGLAKDKRDSSLTRFAFQAGTDEYSSPQQLADARSVDERDDMFSLGKTFYEMLTGVIFIDNSQFLDIAQYNADVPLGMDGIIRACIHLKRDERYQTVSELRKAILQV